MNLGFPMPKLPKMPEKPNAHEKLVEWKKYKRSIEYYFGLMKRKLPTAQRLQLLYLGGGTEVQKALEHYALPTHGDDELAYEEMILHMDKHFQTGVDSLAYLIQLFGMRQKDSEPFADFAQRLKAQADLCDLGTARENLLKTQIQKGARNAKIFASAEAWVNKSLDDIIGLGIADETGSLQLGSKKQEAPDATTANSDETFVGSVSDHGRSGPRRLPRSWRRPEGRGSFRGFPKRYTNQGRGSSRAYPYASGQGPNTSWQGPYASGQGRPSENAANIRCFNCQKLGHVMRNCRNNVYSLDNNDQKVEEICE